MLVVDGAVVDAALVGGGAVVATAVAGPFVAATSIDATSTAGGDPAHPASARPTISSAHGRMRSTVPHRHPAAPGAYDGGVVRVGRRHLLAVVATAALIGLAGCGQDAEQSAGERGERAYRANCAACHANDLGGTSLGPTLLGPGPSDLSDAELRDVIRNGVENDDSEFGAMPGNMVLRDAQVTEIIAFLRTQQADAGP